MFLIQFLSSLSSLPSPFNCEEVPNCNWRDQHESISRQARYYWKLCQSTITLACCIPLKRERKKLNPALQLGSQWNFKQSSQKSHLMVQRVLMQRFSVGNSSRTWQRQRTEAPNNNKTRPGRRVSRSTQIEAGASFHIIQATCVGSLSFTRIRHSVKV